MKIAATAFSLGFSVATLNSAEFKRISGLHLLDVAPFRAT
jgi:predicted nucleic acid-binding protein